MYLLSFLERIKANSVDPTPMQYTEGTLLWSSPNAVHVIDASSKIISRLESLGSPSDHPSLKTVIYACAFFLFVLKKYLLIYNI